MGVARPEARGRGAQGLLAWVGLGLGLGSGFGLGLGLGLRLGFGFGFGFGFGCGFGFGLGARQLLTRFELEKPPPRRRGPERAHEHGVPG